MQISTRELASYLYKYAGLVEAESTRMCTVSVICNSDEAAELHSKLQQEMKTVRELAGALHEAKLSFLI